MSLQANLPRWLSVKDEKGSATAPLLFFVDVSPGCHLPIPHPGMTPLPVNSRYIK
jgi:hypothetical protein